jgi:hypothetical protein
MNPVAVTSKHFFAKGDVSIETSPLVFLFDIQMDV